MIPFLSMEEALGLVAGIVLSVGILIWICRMVIKTAKGLRKK